MYMDFFIQLSDFASGSSGSSGRFGNAGNSCVSEFHRWNFHGIYRSWNCFWFHTFPSGETWAIWKAPIASHTLAQKWRMVREVLKIYLTEHRLCFGEEPASLQPMSKFNVHHDITFTGDIAILEGPNTHLILSHFPTDLCPFYRGPSIVARILGSIGAISNAIVSCSITFPNE